MLGSKVVDKLRDHGDEVVAASPKTGVNTVTGEGLADALTGADVVVDVSNFTLVRRRSGDGVVHEIDG
jgi:uncharacterized protein YbjT (DUF2867 family)